MKSFLKKREIRITRRQAVIAAIAVVVLVSSDLLVYYSSSGTCTGSSGSSCGTGDTR